MQQQSCRSRQNSYHTDSLPSTVANLVEAIPSTWNTTIIPLEHTTNTNNISTTQTQHLLTTSTLTPMTLANIDHKPNDENDINVNNENTTCNGNRGRSLHN